MWNPYLGEKLYIGTFPHLSWFHRPLPTLSHNCSISLRQLQLLLTCQILKILWLSLHWRRCHCLVRQVPGGHRLRPCSEALFSTSNTKVQVSADTSGPLKGEDGTKSLPSWGPFLFIHSNLPKIKWMWLHSQDSPALHEARTLTPTHLPSQDVTKISQCHLSYTAGSLCTSLYAPVALTWEEAIGVVGFKPSKPGAHSISQTQMDTCWWVQESS